MAMSAREARNAVCGPGCGATALILPCLCRGGGPCEAWWRGIGTEPAPPPTLGWGPPPPYSGGDLSAPPIVRQPEHDHRPRRHRASVRVLHHRPVPEHAEMPADIDQSAFLVREL